MKMPFGVHSGKELEELPDSFLRWIDLRVETEPPANVPLEQREAYRITRLQLRQETRRILNERRRNGVRVPDPVRTARCTSCKASIVWLRTTARNSMPVDAESVSPGDTEFDSKKHRSHFATCPRADWHRSPRA